MPQKTDSNNSIPHIDYRLMSFCRTAVLSIVALLCCACAVHATDKADKTAKVAFLEKLRNAADLSDVRGNQDLPIRLRAKFTFQHPKEETRTGAYEYVRLSRDVWRQEIVYPGFADSRAALRDKIWIRRNVPFEPARVSQLEGLLLFTQHLKLRVGEKLGKLRTNGDQQCGEMGRGRPHIREICVGLDGLIRSIRWMSGAPGTDDMLEISEYRNAGLKKFPRRFRYIDMGKPGIEIDITEVGAPRAEDTETMMPPPAAESRDWCSAPEPPKEIKRLDLGALVPAFPPSKDDAWRVRLYFLIDLDGALKNAMLTEAPASFLDAKRLDRVTRGARFRPASCNGKPVPTEMHFYFTYNRAH